MDEVRSYTVAQVAELTGFSRRTVERWIETGDLITWRIAGGDPRVAHLDLAAFIEARRVVATQVAGPVVKARSRNGKKRRAPLLVAV